MNSMDTTTVFDPPPVTPTNAFVAVDLEMMGLPENQIHRPKPSCFGLATFTIGGTCYICKTPTETQTALHNTNQSILVFHNAMFDITHLRSVANFPDRKKIWDTLLIERILFNGYYSGFGLEDLAARYLDVSMDKSGQKLWAKAHTWDNVTDDMVTYASDDGYITERIAPLQKAKMTPNDINVWTQIDRPAMWAVQAMRGFPIDLPKFKALSEHNLQESEVRDGQLSFNPRSPKQVIDHFYSEYKIKLSSSDEEAVADLQSQIDEGKLKKKLKADQIEQIKKELLLIAEGRFYRKMGSTYGTSILDIIEYEDDVPVVHGSYNISGAMTGRMCVAGNTQLETSLGICAISDLVLTSNSYVGIMSHTGTERKILNKWYKGEEEMYKVTTSSGNSILCTKGHRFLTPVGWRHLHELREGNSIYTVTNSPRRKSKSLIREKFSSGLFGNHSNYHRSNSAVWNRKKSVFGILEVLFNNSSRRDAETKTPILLKISKEAGKYSWISKGYAACGGREARIDSKDFTRKDRIRNSKRDGCGSSNHKKSCSTVQIKSSIKESKKPNRKRMGNFRNSGSNFSRNYGSILSFAGRSSTSFQSFVSISGESGGHFIFNKENGEALRLLSIKGSSETGPHFLEDKRTRNTVIPGITQGKRSSHSRISLGKTNSPRVCCGHLHSAKLIGGNKWINSSVDTYDKTRQGKNKVGNFSWIQGNGIYNSRCDESFRLGDVLYQTDYITSIVSVGVQDVWDIEVEKDHSYVAHGFVNHNSCDSPNMQNIPARIGPVFRECFVPYPDEVLVIGDYSSQEPRITASYSDDPILLDIFVQDIDVYIEMGYMTYGERFDKKDVRRKYMKDMFLGMCYGLSKYGMAKKYGWSLDQAEKLIDKTFRHFPTARKYIEKARKNKSFTLTKGGRRFWLNPYSNQVERHSLNAPIQGTASDQMKLALSRVYQNWPVEMCKFGVVAIVHDEMVCSVPKIHAPFFRDYIENQMVRAASDICPGVPFKSDVHICESWAEK